MAGENELLANITATGNSNPITVDDVSNYNFGLSPDEEQLYNQSQQQFNPVNQPLNTNDYYPNQGDPIGVGQSSGRIIGSQTQYVPNGGLVPIGMWDARDAAIQKAAMAKAKDVADWKAKNAKAPTSKLTNINENITKEFFNHQDSAWKQAMKASGGDANKAKFLLENNQDYQAKNKSFYDSAKMGDAIVEQDIQIANDLKSGKMVETPAMAEARQKLHLALDPNNPEFKDLANRYTAFQAVKEYNDAYNTVLDKMTREQLASSGIDESNPDYINEYKSTREYMRDDQKQAIEDNLNTLYKGRGDDFYTPEFIRKDVWGRNAGVRETSDKNAQFRPGERGGLDEKITEDNVASEPSVRNIENQVKQGRGTEGESKDYNNEQVVGYNGQTLKKPVKIDVAAGTQIYDLSGGNKNFINTKLKGVKKMEVAGSELVDVVDAPGTTENGRVVTEQYRKRNPDAKTKKVAMAIVSYEGEANKIKNANGQLVDEKDDKGNPVTKTVTAYVPLKSIRNGVEKKVNGVYKGGLNVDLSLKAEEEYNSGNRKSKEFDVVKTGEGKKTVAVEKASNVPRPYTGVTSAKGPDGKEIKIGVYNNKWYNIDTGEEIK